MPTKNAPRMQLRSAPIASEALARRIKQRAGMLRLVVSAGAMKSLKVQAAQPIAPGVERWAVKTGTDADVGKVDLSSAVVATTVEELQAAKRPPALDRNERAFFSKRIAPVETIVWEVNCRVTAVKFEVDGDYHLVLQGESGETIIGEIPYPQPPFVASSSPFVPDIARARATAEAKILKKIPKKAFAAMGKYMVPLGAFAPPVPKTRRIIPPVTEKTLKVGAKSSGTAFKTAIVPVTVTVRGVGFFDRLHGQMGVAPNGIELHPILDLIVNDSGRSRDRPRGSKR